MNWELHELNSLFELNVVPGRVPGTQVRDEYTICDMPDMIGKYVIHRFVMTGFFRRLSGAGGPPFFFQSFFFQIWPLIGYRM